VDPVEDLPGPQGLWYIPRTMINGTYSSWDQSAQYFRDVHDTVLCYSAEAAGGKWSICSDSQATLNALAATKVTSNLWLN